LQTNYNTMSSFRDLIATQGYKAFMRKILFYSITILIIGLLFLWRHWAGAETMILLGGGTFAIWLILFIIGKIVSNQD